MMDLLNFAGGLFSAAVIFRLGWEFAGWVMSEGRSP